MPVKKQRRGPAGGAGGRDAPFSPLCPRNQDKVLGGGGGSTLPAITKTEGAACRQLVLFRSLPGRKGHELLLSVNGAGKVAGSLGAHEAGILRRYNVTRFASLFIWSIYCMRRSLPLVPSFLVTDLLEAVSLRCLVLHDSLVLSLLFCPFCSIS